MMNPGYTQADLDELDLVMAQAHYLAIKIELMDLNHNHESDLSSMFVDGVVSVDADADVTRAADITLFDPFKSVQLDPDSPAKSSVYITNMIGIVYCVINAEQTKRWDIPVFTGPIDKAERDDVWLNIKCLGKESLSISNLWLGKTFKKGQQKVDVIRQIMRELVGETRFQFISADGKLPNEQKLNRASRPWRVARLLANSLALQLFYDGTGTCVLRLRSTNPVYHFTEKNITSQPHPVYDLSNVINAVDVVGKKKKGKGKIGFRAVADWTHNLSPWSIGRGNPVVPRYLWTEIKDDSIRTNGEAKVLARKVLTAGLMSGVEIKHDGIPVSRLQELDVVRIDTRTVNETYVGRKFTIPLVAGDDATFGYLKRMAPKGGARATQAPKAINDKTKRRARR